MSHRDAQATPPGLPETEVMNEGFLTVQEFLDTYALSRSTFYRLVENGFPIIKIGRATRIARADAAAWAQSLPSRGTSLVMEAV